MNEEELMKAFEDKNGVLKTSELNQMGLSSRQIKNYWIKSISEKLNMAIMSLMILAFRMRP